MTLFIAGLLLYHMNAEWWLYLIALAIWGAHRYALTHFRRGQCPIFRGTNR